MNTLAQGQNITGTVFRDFNSSGARDNTSSLNEVGVGGVRVSAYTTTGAFSTSVLSSTATATLGQYSLNVGNTNAYRIEFTNLPSGDFDAFRGVGSGTSVQFANGNSTGVNLGINYPTDYCQANPELVTSCYVFGNQQGGPSDNPTTVGTYGSDPVLITFPYTAGSRTIQELTGASGIYDQPLTHQVMIRAKQVGTTLGLAYARKTKKLYSAAFFKKHAGFGLGGPGAIYVSDATSTSTVITTFTVPGATTNAHNTADYNRDNDNVAWDAVGKTSLGGMDLSDDEDSLYVMNLQNRTLYALNPTTGSVLGSQAVPLSPLPPGCPTAGDVRPFAVEYHRGKVYVGIVCSAESSNSAANLKAYLYTVNPATLAFATTPAFQMNLNYPRGKANSTGPADWLPWRNSFSTVNTNTAARLTYPMPIFTNITFDNGDLIIGLRDRIGDIAGNQSKDNPATQDLYQGRIAGDILRAGGSPATGWTLENEGRSEGNGTAVQNTGQGPGTTGAEFYHGDSYPISTGGVVSGAISGTTGIGVNHDEVSLGTMTQIPGFVEVAAVVFDPTLDDGSDGFFDGGVRWLNNITGAWAQSYRVYNGVGTGTAPDFGKAAGLGELIPFCDLPPIQIGNRVWKDLNNNGIQDPGEPALPGVTVTLKGPGLPAAGATVTTNANGEYYFSNATGTAAAGFAYSLTGLSSGSSYSLSFPTSFSTLSLSTKANSATGTNADAIDTDPNATGIVSFTLGQAGQNNFTYDAAYVLPASLGDYVFEDKNANGIQDTGDVPIPGVVVTLLSSGSVIATTTTNGSGLYSFTNLTPGTPYSVSFTAPAGFVGTITNVGSDTADSDGNPTTGLTGTYSLTAGENNPTIDMGYVKPASLGDYVFFDADKSGTQNAGDVPIPGVVVTLFLNGSAVATTTTNGSGLYSFTGLTPGSSNSYVVGFTTPSGYTATTTNTGSNSAVDSDLIAATGRTISYTLSSGQNNTSIDAGFICKLPSVTAVASGPVCLGTPITLTALISPAGSYTYAWAGPGGVTITGGSTATAIATGLPTGTSTFTVTVTSTPFCSTVATVSVVVNPVPVASLSASSATICAGSSTTLTASGGTSYSFSTGLVNTTGILVASPASTTVYSVTVANASGCKSTTSVGITVNTLPVATLSSATVCAGQTATLTATGGTSYTLTPGNVVNTTGIFSLTPASTTTYTVVVANASGCKSTTTGTISVNQPPVATLSSTSICAGTTATLTATGGTSYTLTPGNVVNMTGLFSLTPASSTTYTVVVANASGCKSTTTGTVTVNLIPVVTVTNVVCNGLTTYAVDFTATTGAVVTADVGTVVGNSVTGIPSGQQVTLTATLNSCTATATANRNCQSNAASLGNFVFEDVNKDGLQDTGDLPIQGAIVTLLQSGTVAGTTTTDVNGLYSFTGLTPGIPYSVSFTTPTGYSTTTTANVGTNDAIDSDPVGGVTAPVTLTAGENNPTLDAGFIKPATPAPTYTIAKTVDLKQVELGQIVTYTLSVTNTSPTTATALVLTDLISNTAVTIVGSATASDGTFVAGSNGGTWSLSSLAGGQVATLSYQVQLNAEGITFNTLTAPNGQTATVCTTVPFRVCANEVFEFALAVPNSYSAYQWSLNGVPIAGATTNTLSATAIGEYTVTGNGVGGCATGACCPFIILDNPAPSLTAVAVSAACVGAVAQANAAITLVDSSTGAVSYNITKGSSFTAAAPLFASPQALSAVVGGVLLGNQTNPALAQDYTIRVYAANGCFADTVVSLQPAFCNCPPPQCSPIVVKKTRSQGKPVAP